VVAWVGLLSSAVARFWFLIKASLETSLDDPASWVRLARVSYGAALALGAALGGFREGAMIVFDYSLVRLSFDLVSTGETEEEGTRVAIERG
jgi:hypothetical protein